MASDYEEEEGSLSGQHRAPNSLGPRAPLPGEISSVPWFHGDGNDAHDARHWVDTLSEYAMMWNWAEGALVRVACTRLVGPAHHWISSMPRDVSWAEFEREFLGRFGERIEAAMQRLSMCKQEQEESVHAYADRFRRDMHLAGRLEDAALRYQFIAGLQRDLRHEVQRQHASIRTMADVVNEAKHWEACFEEEWRDPNARGNSGSYVPPHQRENQQPRRDPWRPNQQYQQQPRQDPWRPNQHPVMSGPRNNYIGAPYRPAYGNSNDFRGPRPGNRDVYPDRKERRPATGHTRGPADLARPDRRLPPPPQQPATAVDDRAIDDLARQLERMQLTMSRWQQDQRRPAVEGSYYREEEPQCINTLSAEQPPADPIQQLVDQWTTMAARYQRWVITCAPDASDAMRIGRELERLHQCLVQMAEQQNVPASSDSALPQRPQQPLAAADQPGCRHHAVISNREDDGYGDDIEWDTDKNGFEIDTALELPETAGEDNFGLTPIANYATKPSAGELEEDMGIMDFISDAEDDFDWEDINITDHIYVEKRPAERAAEPFKRMPAQRVAFDMTAGPSRGPPQEDGAGAQGIPRRPTQGQGGPSGLRPPAPQRGAYPAPPSGGIRPPGDPARRTDPIPGLTPEELAESKGKEMALKACRALSVDAVKEDHLVISAAKICVAGHLLGIRKVIEAGKDLARRTGGFDRRHMQNALASLFGSGGPAAAQANMCMPAALYDMELEAPRKPGYRSEDETGCVTRVSTCKALVRLGTPSSAARYDTYAIVDTGASQSAITLDTVRRMGLNKCIDENGKSFFYNADGRKSETVGIMRDFPVTIGELTTKVTFSVTDALSYDVLLGNDFLLAIGARIDLKNKELKYDIRSNLEGRVDVLCYTRQPEPASVCSYFEDSNVDLIDAFWRCDDMAYVYKMRRYGERWPPGNVSEDRARVLFMTPPGARTLKKEKSMAPREVILQGD